MDKKLTKIRMTNTNRPLDVIRHWHSEGFLLMDLPYQRGDVWGAKRRVNLIKSILLGIPIPSIIINDRMRAGWGFDEWKYAVIDGKQRCQTILMFLNNKFAIPCEWVGMSGFVFFKDLPVSIQRGIRHSTLGFCEGVLPNIEAEREVFELVNFGGVPQGESDEWI